MVDKGSGVVFGRGSVGFDLSSLVIGSKCQTSDIPGTRAVMLRREWSDEWRVRCVSESSAGSAPPVNVGDRYSCSLSDRAARAIRDSGNYVGCLRGGYSTFLTLTLDAEARRRVVSRVSVPDLRQTYLEGGADVVGGHCVWGCFSRVRFAWASSVQREASRFFDAMRKMYRRGWVSRYERCGEGDCEGVVFSEIRYRDSPLRGHHEEGGSDGSRDDFDYMWVAEAPKNESGDENIHLHVMLRWRVKWSVFGEWAKRVERLWGCGFAKIEKIRSKEAASGYLLKAVGYLLKGTGAATDQGMIRGNRYAISRSARAEGWECVTAWAWEGFGWAVDDVREEFKGVTSSIDGKISKIKSRIAGSSGARRRAMYRVLSALRERRKRLPVFERFGVVARGFDLFDDILSRIQRCGFVFRRAPARGWLGEFRRRMLSRRRDREVESWLSLLSFESCGWESLRRDVDSYVNFVRVGFGGVEYGE